MLVAQKCASRYSKRAVIYLTAAIEYITGELLEVSSIKAQEAKRGTISNRHVYMGAKADKELFGIVLGHTGYIMDAGFTTDNPIAVSKKAKKETEKKN